MDFGDWVAVCRKDKAMDLRTLSELAGVDIGTISRIENHRTQSTVYTAFHICKGLNERLSVILNALEEGEYSPPDFIEKGISERDGGILRIGHIEKLVETYMNDRDFQERTVSNYLAEQINVLMHSENYVRRFRKLDSRSVRNHTFSKNDIEMILNKSPLYAFEVKYPTGIKLNDVIRSYANNGAMMLEDIEAYIKGLRHAADLAEKRGSPVRFTDRFIEPIRPPDRLKFSELLQWDTELMQQGVLIRMYWKVCIFDDKFNPVSSRTNREFSQLSFFDFLEDEDIASLYENNEEPVLKKNPNLIPNRLATLYLRIYRWFQYLNISSKFSTFR